MCEQVGVRLWLGHIVAIMSIETTTKLTPRESTSEESLHPEKYDETEHILSQQQRPNLLLPITNL